MSEKDGIKVCARSKLTYTHTHTYIKRCVKILLTYTKVCVYFTISGVRLCICINVVDENDDCANYSRTATSN